MTQTTKAKAFARRGRREEELGRDPVCYRCGYDGFDALTRVEVDAFEEHHVDGRNHTEDFTVIVCRNCHAILHGQYSDEGVLLEVQRNPLDTLIEKRRARESLLRNLLECYREDTRWLEDLRDYLNERHPEWDEELER